jgi:hypothetical protein
MGNNEPTDADLVANVLAGDCEAFGCLDDRYARLRQQVTAGGGRATSRRLLQECSGGAKVKLRLWVMNRSGLS